MRESMRSVYALLALSFLLTTSLNAEDAPLAPGFERVQMPLVARVAQQDRARPDSLADFSHSAETERMFRSMLEALLDKDWSTASTLANSIKYEIVTIAENDSLFIVASDQSRTGQNPTVVINQHPRFQLVAGAPHAAFETGTAEQAALLVSEIGAASAVISGAHRCASRTFVQCDGKTPVCGAREPYRTSDVAHNPATLFHLAHVLLLERQPQSIVFSLHGMREDNDEIPTSMILSHGNKLPDVSESSTATKLRYALAETFGGNGEVVSCDLPDDKKYDARPLCGYTNVQGRYVNGDNDVCLLSMDEGTGRFVHIEQDWKVLKHFDKNWGDLENNAVIANFLSAVASTMQSD